MLRYFGFAGAYIGNPVLQDWSRLGTPRSFRRTSTRRAATRWPPETLRFVALGLLSGLFAWLLVRVTLYACAHQTLRVTLMTASSQLLWLVLMGLLRELLPMLPVTTVLLLWVVIVKWVNACFPCLLPVLAGAYVTCGLCIAGARQAILSRLP